MSFDVGPIFLAAGASTRVSIWFGHPGDDRGAQWIMAHPLAGEIPCELVVSDHSKILNYSPIGILTNGATRYDLAPDKAYYGYAVTITNLGPQGVRFNVQGGGNT